MSINLSHSVPPKGLARRIWSGIYRQSAKSHRCPHLPRLEGQRALVTGGAAGVGEYVSRGLVARGAKVTSMARGLSKASAGIPGVCAIAVDLADPETIVSAVDQLGVEPFDIVVCNAGILCNEVAGSPIGVEKTVAVNVVGHHLLYRLLIERKLLSKNAKVILTTGDIYCSESACSLTIPFDTTSKTYARSKLGNLWQVYQLTERYPEIHAMAVHPGVVASGFAGAKAGLLAKARQWLLISEEQGAQSALIAATQDLPRGSYWHNTLGLVDLPKSDPAIDAMKSFKLWEELERLSIPYLKQQRSLTED